MAWALLIALCAVVAAIGYWGARVCRVKETAGVARLSAVILSTVIFAIGAAEILATF